MWCWDKMPQIELMHVRSVSVQCNTYAFDIITQPLKLVATNNRVHW